METDKSSCTMSVQNDEFGKLPFTKEYPSSFSPGISAESTASSLETSTLSMPSALSLSSPQSCFLLKDTIGFDTDASKTPPLDFVLPSSILSETISSSATEMYNSSTVSAATAAASLTSASKTPLTSSVASTNFTSARPFASLSSTTAVSPSIILPHSLCSQSNRNNLQYGNVQIQPPLMSITNQQFTSPAGKMIGKRKSSTAEVPRQETLTKKIVPRWDEFALRKKEKENSLSKDLSDAIQHANANVTEATSQMTKYIEWKKSLGKKEGKGNSVNIIKNLNINTGDGFLNIIQRRFLLLSVEDQRKILIKMLDVIESFEE